MTPLAHMLTRYWALDQAQARRWWQAVCRARWSATQEWRRKVLLFDRGIVAPLSDQQAVEAVARFLTTQASPVAVMAVLENLVREQVLRHTDAREIETKVLHQVDKCGRWK